MGLLSWPFLWSPYLRQKGTLQGKRLGLLCIRLRKSTSSRQLFQSWHHCRLVEVRWSIGFPPAPEGSASRPRADSDPIFQKYLKHTDCQNKNIMVCRNCFDCETRNVTLKAVDSDFTVWCFDHGNFLNRVSKLKAALVSYMT